MTLEGKSKSRGKAKKHSNVWYQVTDTLCLLGGTSQRRSATDQRHPDG